MADKRKSGSLTEWFFFILPHVCIVLGGMLLVFFFIDSVNQHIWFMFEGAYKIVGMLLALLGIILAARMSYINRRMYQARLKKGKKAATK